MKIDIKHIAELSRIKLTKEELRKFTPQMKTILESVNVLQEVDTKKIRPMKKHVDLGECREDSPETKLSQEDITRNAPHSENGYVKVYGEIFGSIEES